MTDIRTYYEPKTRLWCAYAVDSEGNSVGEAQWGPTREFAIFYLGMNHSNG